MAKTLQTLGPQGATLTCKLFPIGSDTATETISLTEATNRKGVFTGTIASASGWQSVVVLNGTTNVGDFVVNVGATDPATYYAKVESAIDLASVQNPTTTLALTGTTIATTQKVDVETIKTQSVTASAPVTVLASVGTAATSTAQTGDAFARIGAPAGASVSADILVLDNLVDDLETRLGTPSNFGSGATVAANLVDIEGQTDDIGAAGAGLTAVGDTRLANLDVTVSSRMATYTQPTGFLAATFPALVAGAAPIRYGVAFSNLTFLMTLARVPVTGATVTTTIRKNAGAFAATTNSATEVGNGIYTIDLTATEMQATIVTLRFTAAGCDDLEITIPVATV